MNTAWIFIEKDKHGYIQRSANYGSFTAMWKKEKAGLKYLAPSEQMLRTVIKYEFEDNLFYIKKHTVKRSKHRK